ncbi:MAG: histone deacetylase [bacterium]
MNKTGFVYHDDFLKHNTGAGHPERAERLQNLVTYLKQIDYLFEFNHIPVTPADLSFIEQIHPKHYIMNIQNSCNSGLTYLDSDTVVSRDSFHAAHLSVGGVVNACDAVMKGKIENAFCAVRPPGHHAEPSTAMGFCLFNNVAIAARYLQNHHSIDKVCIIDWDVHHGNGTQNAFYDDSSVFYISIHQHPLYPGTGRAEERGQGAGEGATLNFPSPPGFGDKDYLNTFEKQIAPEVRNFNPDYILISAGFDAHRDDPLANMQVTEEGFGEMTVLIKLLAEECCQGRFVSLLEGGYNLNALAHSVEAHLKNMQS